MIHKVEHMSGALPIQGSDYSSIVHGIVDPLSCLFDLLHSNISVRGCEHDKADIDMTTCIGYKKTAGNL